MVVAKTSDIARVAIMMVIPLCSTLSIITRFTTAVVVATVIELATM